ncbi:hypothetical protein SALBM135S_07960 [Streptomyces alboniger]
MPNAGLPVLGKDGAHYCGLLVKSTVIMKENLQELQRARHVGRLPRHPRRERP